MRGQFTSVLQPSDQVSMHVQVNTRHASVQLKTSKPRTNNLFSKPSLRRNDRKVNLVRMNLAAMPPAVPGITPGSMGSMDVPSSPIVTPESFTLPPGRLGPINRTSSPSPTDIYRCAGCTEPACQGAFGCASTPWRLQPGGYLREILTAKVYDVAIETPLQLAQGLSTSLGSTIYLKREDLQPVKSFKLRGAYNKMAQLTPEQLEKGVICSSAGNHAQGVALAAAKLGCSAIICMPVTTPDIKVAAVRSLGGIVELIGESYQETQAYAQEKSAKEGRAFIAPYDDPYTISGQGTIATEILRQLDMDTLDIIFVAIGGGGMIAGIAAYVKTLKPDIKVIGVEPVGANAMAQSLALGERVQLSRVDAFADGVAVKQVGAETFRICRELLDGIILVDNASISTAIKDVFNETRSILEPSGAVAVAGAKSYLKHYNLQGATVVAVTSGANMNFDRLRQVADLADTGESEAMLAVSFPETKGSFMNFVQCALNQHNTDAASNGAGDEPTANNIDITELKYRYSVGRRASVLLGVDIAPGSEECNKLIERLDRGGYTTVDISTMEMAQVHLRHLVGGHAAATIIADTTAAAASSMDEESGSAKKNGGSTGKEKSGGSGNAVDKGLVHERIFQVIFPEKPGALLRFLPEVSPQWALTLFHYRSTGNRSSEVLVGIEVPSDEKEQFDQAIARLESNGFILSEIGGKEEEVFKMFLQ